MIYFLIVLCKVIFDYYVLFGIWEKKKVVDKYELLYSEYENLHVEGFSNLEIYDIVYCRWCVL